MRLLQPIPFAVRAYALPDLFAGKMHAVLCRRWKTRVKGHDWYDLVWYAAHQPQLHLAHLEQRMRQSGHWKKEMALSAESFETLMQNAIDRLDVNQARREVEPFVSKIINFRGEWVMFDHDLAEMDAVETRVLKQAVRRNIDRLPYDFMFDLTNKENDSLRSQFVTSRGEI